MAMLIEQECDLTLFAEDAGIPLNSCANEQGRAELRKDKILAIQQQLANGTYDINCRLDAILDKLVTICCG
jgi:hypothetical protein